MTHSYQISGMTCNSCVAKVKSELLKIGDVTAAEVQREAPQASISMSRHIALSALQEAVSKAGNYTIAEASLDAMPMTEAMAADAPPSYLPIVLIFGYIAGAALLVQLGRGAFDWQSWMMDFMAGFFLVFSFFKMISLRPFAEGYRSYDLVAKAVPAFGFVYPFVELALGVAFLTRFEPRLTNIVTLIVMGISTIGVVRSLLKKQQFQCACLGTVIKLPLSKVTLAEDLLMVLMSAAMLIF
jgi:copper chaperone CopZ